MNFLHHFIGQGNEQDLLFTVYLLGHFYTDRLERSYSCIFYVLFIDCEQNLLVNQMFIFVLNPVCIIQAKGHEICHAL